MSIRSMMIRPPMLRKRSWCTTSFTASRLVLQHRLLEIALADVAAGVHVDRGQRLALVDDQVAAGLEPDLAAEVGVDLGLDAEVVEDRQRAAVELDARLRVGDEARHEGLHLLVDLRRVDHDALRLGVRDVADHAQRQRRLGVEHGRRATLSLADLDLVPDRRQVAARRPRGRPRARPRRRCG